jgi:hypothetical protein
MWELICIYSLLKEKREVFGTRTAGKDQFHFLAFCFYFLLFKGDENGKYIGLF